MYVCVEREMKGTEIEAKMRERSRERETNGERWRQERKNRRYVLW